jgi:8-oxo-dGTP diphosphatase
VSEPKASEPKRQPRPDVCVGAVVIDDDRLLLIRRGHGPAAGNWSLPGGRVEFGETMVEALVREVQEETGLDVVVGDYIGHIEIFGDE